MSNRALLLAAAAAAVIQFAAPAPGEAAPFSSDPVLEGYIRTGMANNLALRQRDFEFDRSMRALSEAKGMFLPTIAIAARYTRAGGGREIVFPVGDLLNPVYSTLNQLLEAGGYPPQDFPFLENEVIPFIREEEHETKVRLVQPVFEAGIWYNYRIHKSLSKASEAGRDAYRRQLVSDIKSSYFNWLKTDEVVELLVETRELLEENLRVSTSLHKNGMSTVDVVYRAETELLRNEQNIAEARKARKLAASYFNFLLNRELTAPIEYPRADFGIPSERLGFEEAYDSARSRREELKQLEYAVEAAGNGVRLSTSKYLPSVSFVLDYGFEGEDYSFTIEDDYWMGSLVLSWTLFDGMQRKARRDQSILERRLYETRLEEVSGQVRLEVMEALDNLDVARLAIKTADARSRSAGRSFEIVRKKYNSGLASQVEFLDARTTMTNADVDRILATYDYQIRQAEFERVAALIPDMEGETHE